MITVRSLVEELMKDNNLIISYVESENGFTLSVRQINDAFNSLPPTEKEKIK